MKELAVKPALSDQHNKSVWLNYGVVTQFIFLQCAQGLVVSECAPHAQIAFIAVTVLSVHSFGADGNGGNGGGGGCDGQDFGYA